MNNICAPFEIWGVFYNPKNLLVTFQYRPELIRSTFMCALDYTHCSAMNDALRSDIAVTSGRHLAIPNIIITFLLQSSQQLLSAPAMYCATGSDG